jgi:hypothetical protein
MDLARLYPLSRQQGCFIVPDVGHIFSAEFCHAIPPTDSVSLPDTPASQPLHASTQFRVCDFRAAGVYNDHSFVIVSQGIVGKARVTEYPILQNDRHSLGNAIELCDLQTKFKKGLQVRAFCYENLRFILVIVCDLDGRMEIIKFASTGEGTQYRQRPGRREWNSSLHHLRN